ncbi:MAG: RidA family protein [Bacteroidota bacterium]
MKISEKLTELGHTLPPAPPPAGVYKPVIAVDHMLYVSGQGPVQSDGSLIIGRVGDDFDVDQGYAAAKQVALTMWSTILTHFDAPERIVRLVKTLGMVNCTPDFPDHPKVINGYSDLMREVLGDDAGVGARSAVGMMLPSGIAVEIEAIFQLN